MENISSQNFNNDYRNIDYNNSSNEVYSNRYDMYDDRYDQRYDPRYDRRYNRDYYPMRYYPYPFCDRYGRCENPIWWYFWPLFFM